MQAVVPAGFVMKHQRRGFGLPGFVASFHEGRMFLRIGRRSVTKSFRPAICNYGEMRIRAAPELGDQFRKRVRKILVVANPEAVALHYDVTAKVGRVVIERG